MQSNSSSRGQRGGGGEEEKWRQQWRGNAATHLQRTTRAHFCTEINSYIKEDRPDINDILENKEKKTNKKPQTQAAPSLKIFRLNKRYYLLQDFLISRDVNYTRRVSNGFGREGVEPVESRSSAVSVQYLLGPNKETSVSEELKNFPSPQTFSWASMKLATTFIQTAFGREGKKHKGRLNYARRKTQKNKGQKQDIKNETWTPSFFPTPFSRGRIFLLLLLLLPSLFNLPCPSGVSTRSSRQEFLPTPRK